MIYFTITITFFCVLCASSPVWGQLTSKLDLRVSIEIQSFINSSSTNWLRGGFAKLRYDEDARPLQLGKALLHGDFHLTDTIWLRSLSSAYTYPDIDLNLIEAYFNYRPLPKGPVRFRIKAGAFHLPLSMENRGLGWSSLYSTTPSVINSWVGEELRVIGSEIDISWPGRVRKSAHSFSLTGGIFGFNDGAGTVLAYRGWAQHDLQTGLGDNLRLIPEFSDQIRKFQPFSEIDDHPGYYLAGSWDYLQRIQLSALHYDNRADPTARRDGQNAWQTVFDNVSIQVELPDEMRLIGQYLFGDTMIYNHDAGIRGIADYESWYILLSKRIYKHRLSIRYENFNVNDLDSLLTTVHNSEENGLSWMLAYRYQLTNAIQIGTEWLRIKTSRDSRNIIQNIASETENQLLINLNYKF